MQHIRRTHIGGEAKGGLLARVQRQAGVGLLVGLLLLPVGVSAQGAGDLDTNFGDDGLVITDFGGGNDEASAVAVQPDGKIVAAGGSSITEIGGHFALARYQPNGTLDASFGGSGLVITDVGGGVAHAVALQPDGKIVAAGGSTGPFAGVSDFALVRYHPNGTLDTTFGDDGRVITDFGGFNDIAIAVALQPGGKIVLAGFSTSDPATGRADFALARYHPNGTLDTTFGGDGRVTTAFEDHAVAVAVALKPNGKIVAAGEAVNLSTGNRDFALARYHPNGTLDTTFGGDGRVTTTFEGDAPAADVALQPNGKIILAGAVGFAPDIALVRYLPNGTLDTTFGDDGRVITDVGDYEFATAVALQPNGKIVAAGFASNNGAAGFALVRYHPNGTLDTTFGDDGRVITDVGGAAASLATALAIQPHNGRLVVAGRTQTVINDSFGSTDFALARYHGGGEGDTDGDGVLDTDDHCPDSIVSPTVVIDGCDSGVPNTIFPNGCTISDKIQQCAIRAQNHGQFVSCVAHLTYELKRKGVITGRQKRAILSCAAHSNIP